MDKIGYVGALLFLGMISDFDIRYKKIPVVWLVIAGSMAMGVCFLTKSCSLLCLCGDLLPGSALLILAFLTGERIGYGDGMVGMILGVFTNGFFCMAVMVIGLTISGIYSLIRIIRKNDDTIPLIPFFLTGMEVLLIIG